jgi:hypothetical protein
LVNALPSVFCVGGTQESEAVSTLAGIAGVVQVSTYDALDSSPVMGCDPTSGFEPVHDPDATHVVPVTPCTFHVIVVAKGALPLDGDAVNVPVTWACASDAASRSGSSRKRFIRGTPLGC